MPANRDYVLPSGAKLHITTATFERALELFKAYSEEIKLLQIDYSMTEAIMDKNIFCTLIDSKRIEKALSACMETVTYNGLKVTMDTFKDPEAWGDYVDVLVEVARDNINPFMKNLSAKFPVAAELMRRALA